MKASNTIKELPNTWKGLIAQKPPKLAKKLTKEPVTKFKANVDTYMRLGAKSIPILWGATTHLRSCPVATWMKRIRWREIWLQRLCFSSDSYRQKTALQRERCYTWWKD